MNNNNTTVQRDIPPLWSVLKDRDTTTPHFSTEASPRSVEYNILSEHEFLERYRDNLNRLLQEKEELEKCWKSASNTDDSARLRDFSERLSAVQENINEVTRLKQDYDNASSEEKKQILASQYPATYQLPVPQQQQFQHQVGTAGRPGFLPPFKSLAVTPTAPSSSSSNFQRLPHLMPSLSSLSGSSQIDSSSSNADKSSARTLQLTSPNQGKALGPTDLVNPQYRTTVTNASAGAAAGAGAGAGSGTVSSLSPNNYQSQFVSAYQGVRGATEGFSYQNPLEQRSNSLNVASILGDKRRESVSLPSFSAATANIVNNQQKQQQGGAPGATPLLPLQAGFGNVLTSPRYGSYDSNVYDRPTVLYGAGLDYSNTRKQPKKRGRKKRAKDEPSSPFGGVLPPPHQLMMSEPQVLKKTTTQRGSNENSSTVTSCLHCGENHTPEWRRGPYGNRTLCNACGLFYRKAISKFGVKNANLLLRYRKRINNTANRRVPKMLKIPIGIIEEFDADATLDGNYNTIRKEE